MRLIEYERLKPDKGIPYTRCHIWRLIKAGKFPKPVKTSGTSRSRNLWVEQEIDDHIRALITERDGVARFIASCARNLYRDETLKP